MVEGSHCRSTEANLNSTNSFFEWDKGIVWFHLKKKKEINKEKREKIIYNYLIYLI